MSAWGLTGCSPGNLGDDTVAITPGFPTTPGHGTATLTWNSTFVNYAPNPTTVIAYAASQPAKNKCAAGSAEWQLLGSVVSDGYSPGVKVHSRVKIMVCVDATGTLHNTIKNRTKVAKL